jgi:hypothetical protein
MTMTWPTLPARSNRASGQDHHRDGQHQTTRRGRVKPVGAVAHARRLGLIA